MKGTPIFFLFLLSTQLCLAQLKFGLQGGLNFDSAGDIKLVSEQLQKEGELKSNSGFHVGGYAQADFLIFYLFQKKSTLLQICAILFDRQLTKLQYHFFGLKHPRKHALHKLRNYNDTDRMHF